MSERNEIFNRIQQALTRPGRRPEHAAAHHLAHRPQPDDFRRVLPAVGRNFAENLALFQRNAADLKADFFLFDNERQAHEKLNEIKLADRWQQVGSHHGRLTQSACATMNLPVCQVDKGYSADDLESCDAGLTECDALVAQTGSVLVTSRSAGGRALSVLPPHHVVLARREQLVPGLPDAFALLKQRYSGQYPSMISIVTGPSRTGDIERILVLGAHGPKKLTILCW